MFLRRAKVSFRFGIHHRMLKPRQTRWTLSVATYYGLKACRVSESLNNIMKHNISEILPTCIPELFLLRTGRGCRFKNSGSEWFLGRTVFSRVKERIDYYMQTQKNKQAIEHSNRQTHGYTYCKYQFIPGVSGLLLEGSVPVGLLILSLRYAK